MGGPQMIFNKIDAIEILHSLEGDFARLSARSNGSSLNAECGNVGSGFTIITRGKESVFLIAKGSLSSVSFYKSDKPIFLLSGIITILLSWGYVLLIEPSVIVWCSALGVILIIAYFFLRTAKLEFESSGGKSVIFQFSGSAAGRGRDMAKFCAAAIMIDKGIKVEGLLEKKAEPILEEVAENIEW